MLVMLFRAHGGNENDHGMLGYWIKHLKRNKNTLWDGRRHLVKDFRACYELFDQIADGYILGMLAQMCGWTNGKALAETFGETDDITDKIKELARKLVDVKQVHTLRQSPRRDRLHENLILLLQHALIMRNFRHAMKHGDIGRLLISFRYTTLFFQASNQHKYAHETIHLTACLKKNMVSRIQGIRPGE